MAQLNMPFRREYSQLEVIPLCHWSYSSVWQWSMAIYCYEMDSYLGQPCISVRYM